MSGDFTPEQKRYLEGFASGLSIGPLARMKESQAPSEPLPPDRAAQARFEAKGKKLSEPERWKREQDPLEAYAKLKEQAARDEFPKPADNFRWRYLGLFYVAPAQDAYMCRLRIPNGILNHWQFDGIATLADKFAGGYAHVTTRANLQMREVPARNATNMLEAILDLGLCSRGSGSDNIRNVTGDATAGIDRQALIDTRPYAREWHFHILNDRTLFGLPRKFNVAFDGGGAIPTLEDTNDIGFQAVEVLQGTEVAPGLYFRLLIGGITGHKDLAKATGIVVKPEEATKVADAIVRVFIDHGDRTDRAKARLKYVIDAWGIEKFLEAVEAKLGKKLLRIDENFTVPRPNQNRQAHIGVHPQIQHDLSYIGVVLPVGKMMSGQIRELAAIARTCGDGDIRLTVWQNLLISGVPSARLTEAQERIEKIGLDWKASSIRAGLIACTGSRGCRFSAADTKGNAEAIAHYCETRVTLDSPVNIHLTGCHNSCAQHYIGDIGLLGARVPVNDDGDTVDGYHIFIGGGFGTSGAIGREIYHNVKAEDAPQMVERLLKAYLKHRSTPQETFDQFSRACDIEVLKLFAQKAA